MRFGHYTVFDTPEENKHTQVYVEYDVPNNDNLDGATGNMILSDGHSETSGGGGDSRFSTCEVGIFFTHNGQPLTLTPGEVTIFNNYKAGTLTNSDDPMKDFYLCFPMIETDNNIIDPLMFEGVAYLSDAHGASGNTFYMADWGTAPVCTGDITFGSFEDSPAVIIRGNGTITIEMIED